MARYSGLCPRAPFWDESGCRAWALRGRLVASVGETEQAADSQVRPGLDQEAGRKTREGQRQGSGLVGCNAGRAVLAPAAAAGSGPGGALPVHTGRCWRRP
jgi:hypothetical protein